LADSQNTPAGILKPFDGVTLFRCKTIGVLKALLNDWSERGRTMPHFQAASILAAHAVANVRQDGRVLCVSGFAHGFKGNSIEQWVTAIPFF